jgi:ketosteroid isomerase-like protein
MPARTPEEICGLFQRFMAEGNLESVLGLYDPEAVFLKESRKTTRGREELRQVLAPLAEAKTRFDFEVKQVVQTDGIALMHTRWRASAPQPMTQHAIEVARRQPDGTWRWLIGDPFTVEREVGARR